MPLAHICFHLGHSWNNFSPKRKDQIAFFYSPVLAFSVFSVYQCRLLHRLSFPHPFFQSCIFFAVALLFIGRNPIWVLLHGGMETFSWLLWLNPAQSRSALLCVAATFAVFRNVSLHLHLSFSAVGGGSFLSSTGVQIALTLKFNSITSCTDIGLPAQSCMLKRARVPTFGGLHWCDACVFSRRILPSATLCFVF